MARPESAELATPEHITAAALGIKYCLAPIVARWGDKFSPMDVHEINKIADLLDFILDQAGEIRAREARAYQNKSRR